MMTGGRNWSHYEERLRRVTDYIHAHLDEELDMDRLAEVACLSPYHWHRIYRAVLGETLAATVKRMRLHTAAVALLENRQTVTQIAIQAGYPNVQSFCRTFAEAYGVPPARFRLTRTRQNLPASHRQEELHSMFDVSIKTLEAFCVVGLPHKGSYVTISKTFDLLVSTLMARQMMPKDAAIVGLYYDDPEVVPAEELRSFAGMVEREPVSLQPPFERVMIEKGDWAVLRYKGPYAEMKRAYDWGFQHWLPASGRDLRHAPCIEFSLNNPRVTPPQDLLTDIYFPIT